MNDPVWVWGVPLTPLTLVETVVAVGDLIEIGRPAYFITANTHYAMLTKKDAGLREFNKRAAFIEVAEEAAQRLCERYPGLQVVGTEYSPFRELTAEEQDALAARIRSTRPDILFLAYTQPKGEKWMDRHLAELGVPVSVQVGASLDFAAGQVRRAARWMQKAGLEWAFRLVPTRLFYAVRPQRMVHRRYGCPRPGTGSQTAPGATFGHTRQRVLPPRGDALMIIEVPGRPRELSFRIAWPGSRNIFIHN
ncbi:MAG: WecB/TagA/CpsF family glycosyltransferase [Isosphaerales bacterium]